MRISSRLILLLAVSVNAVLIIATFFILRQLESNLKTAARDEIRAHVTTLRLALEEDYLSGRSIDAQRLINRLGSSFQ
jgi:cell division protein FtsL